MPKSRISVHFELITTILTHLKAPYTINSSHWKDTVEEGCKAFESNRIDRAVVKHTVRKKIPCNIPEERTGHMSTVVVCCY